LQSVKTILLTSIAALFLATGTAHACDEASIDHISANGDIIELDDGTEWEVSPGDQTTVLSWSEGDDVLVCNNKIINKDEDGEKIDVTQR
jgi:hypothetical protein